VNEIYAHAKVKLSPEPMTSKRDSASSFYEHHQMIEAQRKDRMGLIAGIKKDIVISNKISADPKPHRVAIYGWHQLNGKPIQPYIPDMWIGMWTIAMGSGWCTEPFGWMETNGLSGSFKRQQAVAAPVG